jgi:hypothetical protein
MVIFLSVGATAALLASFFYSAEVSEGRTLCLFRNATGLRCPGCGLTRSFCAISHGDFGAAWHYNPFGYVYYAGALLLVPAPLVVWLRPGLPDRLYHSWAGAWIPLVFIAALLLFGIWRLLSGG